MQRKLFRPLAAVTFVALAAVGSAAQARDNVYWSLGIDAAPGVSLGLGNVRPVVVAPAPVYLAPQPVYLAQPVYVAPQPVYVAPAAVYYGPPGRRVGWHRHHHRHWD